MTRRHDAGDASLCVEEACLNDVWGTDEFPVYRVTFWSPRPKLADGRLASPNALRVRVSGARDVAELMRWIADQGHEGCVEVHVEITDPPRDGETGGVQLLRVSGFNPVRGAENNPAKYVSDAEEVRRLRRLYREE